MRLTPFANYAFGILLILLGIALALGIVLEIRAL